MVVRCKNQNNCSSQDICFCKGRQQVKKARIFKMWPVFCQKIATVVSLTKCFIMSMRKTIPKDTKKKILKTNSDDLMLKK